MHLTMHDDPGVWADLQTADYDTGVSSTDEFQSDGPASPTNLVATPHPFRIEFSVSLPSYMQAGAVVELFEHTAATPFESATKVAEFRGNRFSLDKGNGDVSYYWVRIRQQNGAVSGTYPALTGLPGFAITAQSNSITLDPEILTASPSTFWSMGSKATLSASGGIRGGVITLAGDNALPLPNFKPLRPGGRCPIALGNAVAFTVRYRRTTTLTASSGNPALQLALFRYNAASGGSSVGDSIEQIDLSGLTLNAWNEKTVVLPIVNTLSGFPFVDFSCSLATTDGVGNVNGTVEIDYLFAETQPSLAGVALFRTFTGTLYTVSASDRYTTTRTTSSSAVTVTLPNSIPDGWSIGQKTEFIRGGTGTVTFSTAGTLRTPGGASITTVNGKATVQLVDVGVWELSGNV